MRMMDSNTGDLCICLSDPWDKIQPYRVLRREGIHLLIEPTNEFPSHSKRRKEKLINLAAFPFGMHRDKKQQELAEVVSEVSDLIRASLSKGRMSLTDLKKLLFEHKENYKYPDEQIETIIRCIVCAGAITPTLRGNKIEFEISKKYLPRERHRSFSATIATELSSLSERIRLIIDHGPTVGTYRENLLQNILKKHLPERYHVATGFILGLPKQIDILIYDRIDYSPVFRENDLVIIPPEAVRAVIEVKTKVNTKSLRSSLDFIHEASLTDDLAPPFFKGIFCFESAMSSSAIRNNIVEYYADIDNQAERKIGNMITEPFKHLTCMCVVERDFIYTHYRRNHDSLLIPYLMEKRSSTKLKSQVSFFMQSLLSHLKYGGVKPYKIDFLGRMLGADTYSRPIKSLVYYDEWGPYITVGQGIDGNGEIEEIERHILDVQAWLAAEENYS